MTNYSKFEAMSVFKGKKSKQNLDWQNAPITKILLWN